nr:PREDICTED: seipin [Bemisia tabaci]
MLFRFLKNTFIYQFFYRRLDRIIFSRYRNLKRRTVETTINGATQVKNTVLNGGVLALVSAAIVWVSIFMYIAFYYAYMPSLSHTRPIHLRFKSCDEAKGICSFPNAHVQLTKRQQMLMVGQAYKIYINLEMPESPANKELGMFMVCALMVDKNQFPASKSCRSAMLHYRSPLLHFLSTVVMSPFLIFGSIEEKQTLNLELYSNYEEDQSHPVTDVYVEIQSRHIELYSASLFIMAHLRGLRYVMFHWPIFSAIVGVSSNLFCIVFIFSLSYWRLYGYDDDHGHEYFYHMLRRRKSDGNMSDSDDEKSGDERPKSSSGESSKYVTEFDVLDKDSPSDVGGSSGTS